MSNGNCYCGSKDCWSSSDYAWLASRSGWRGKISGCDSSVFFIHGKMIREQRDIPTGSFSLRELPRLLAQWGAGLSDAELLYSYDTGGGECGLWIEGTREPNDADWVRLEEARTRERQKAAADLASIRERFPDLR